MPGFRLPISPHINLYQLASLIFDSCNSKISGMKKVAVIGFGFMGKTHTLNILKNESLELAAIVDSNIEKTDNSGNSDGGNISTGSIDPNILSRIRKYSSLSECLNKEALDAVCICVHTDLHYEMAKMALLGGKHVFMEKPFCLDIRQAEELIRIAKEKEKILMIAHVVRFMPPYLKLKQWIDSKEYGELKFLSLSRFAGVPTWGQWKTKQQDYGSSGGALFDLAIHDIDYANYILGQPDNIQCDYLPGPLSKHDYINAIWYYKERDISVKIEGGNTFHPTFPFRAEFIARFEKASIYYSSLKGDVIQIATESTLEDISAGDAMEGFQNEIDYFAKCLVTNSQPEECMPESSLQSIKLCYSHIQ